MKMTFTGIGLAALVGGTALATPSISIIREPVRVQRVSFADLDLAAAQGQRALEGRIRVAAGDVCERSVEAPESARSCYASAVARGRSQAGAIGVGNRDIVLSSAVVMVRGQ